MSTDPSPYLPIAPSLLNKGRDHIPDTFSTGQVRQRHQLEAVGLQSHFQHLPLQDGGLIWYVPLSYDHEVTKGNRQVGREVSVVGKPQSEQSTNPLEQSREKDFLQPEQISRPTWGTAGILEKSSASWGMPGHDRP